MSEEFIKVTHRHTHGHTDTRTELLPELLVGAKKLISIDKPSPKSKPQIPKSQTQKVKGEFGLRVFTKIS